MLEGVLLILVLMLAVYGAYCAADLVLSVIHHSKDTAARIVVLKAKEGSDVWEGVLDARTRFPDIPIVVLCEKQAPLTPPDAGWRGIAFAQEETLAQTVCAMLCQ